jgi:hypothetical protein
VPVSRIPDATLDQFAKFAATVDRIQAAAKKTEPEPTDAQKESGRYRKGRVSWKGLTLAIETAAGNKRSPEWPALEDHYGYVEGTESGADGDAVDVFISEEHPDSELVFVVNQKKPDGTFDEHKCILGCISLDQAKKTYLRNYSPGWTGMGEVSSLTLSQFKWWLEHADTSKEVKNGYFAAVENRKPEKKGSADPFSGMDDDERETFDRADDEAALEQAMAKKEYLNRYKCPNCGGENLLNGDPKGGVRFRGSGHCTDCGEGCTIVGLRLKSIGRGPELEWSEERKKRFLAGRRLDRRLAKRAFEEYVPVLTFVKRADDADHPFTIAVDFDGTLAEAQVPFDPQTCGEPREAALRWVRLFHENGARIIIFTVRGNTKPVEAWLKKHDVPFDFINENPDQPPGSSGKVYADAYWDDRAYNAVDPDECGPEILTKLLGHAEGEPEGDDSSPVIVIRRETVVTITGPSLLAAMEGTDDDEGTGED